jgi:toxin ParE1/3/4
VRNPAAADTFIQAIDGKFEQLSRFPFIGRERSTVAAGIRSIVVRTHLIFYTIERERIIVIRVIDGRMDVDEEFQR